MRIVDTVWTALKKADRPLKSRELMTLLPELSEGNVWAAVSILEHNKCAESFKQEDPKTKRPVKYYIPTKSPVGKSMKPLGRKKKAVPSVGKLERRIRELEAELAEAQKPDDRYESLAGMVEFVCNEVGIDPALPTEARLQRLGISYFKARMEAAPFHRPQYSNGKALEA